MRIHRLLVCTLCALALAPAHATARQVAGTVVDRATGAGIASALVQLIAADSTVLATAFTDERGGFALRVSATRDQALYVSRLDYGSVRVPLRDLEGDLSSLRVALDVRPVELGGLEATATARNRWLDAHGFYDRQKTGLGKFITREMIENDFGTPTRVEEILRQVPGVLRVQEYFRGAIVYMRGAMVNLQSVSNQPVPCPAKIYVDGLYQTDYLHRIHPNDIEAIEVYRGPAEIPPQYGGAYAMCGVILIWTRMGA